MIKPKMININDRWVDGPQIYYYTLIRVKIFLPPFQCAAGALVKNICT